MPVVLVSVAVLLPTPARAIDEEHRRKGDEVASRAVAWLRSRQDAATGGWAVSPDGPQYPAITGLVVTGLLMREGIDGFDPAVAGGVRFMLSYRQEDGGIYDRLLPSYNTAICVSALSKLKSPEATDAVEGAVVFLRGLQYGESARAEAAGGQSMVVGPDHAFYGGFGYGRNSRPDNSNLGFALEALHDAGVPASDEAFRRALVFLGRTQMIDAVNDMPYADGSRQGGFIYATSENAETIGLGQSFAGTIEETLDDGTVASRLRAYGSMTYVGFKSLIYAGLDRDDPRVRAAAGWIASNYTLEENPGVGNDGMYYYLLTFARALDAWSGPGDRDFIDVTPAGGPAERRDWANDLIDRLAGLQQEDGSFRVVDDRWMENSPDLITAYALIALGHATR